MQQTFGYKQSVESDGRNVIINSNNGIIRVEHADILELAYGLLKHLQEVGLHE